MGMLDGLKKQLLKLGAMELEISAHGVYPNKYQTKVQNVAMYQNDGTKYIKASKFVERAAKSKNNWRRPVNIAIGKFLKGDEDGMNAAGRIIARDINEWVDRIDTHRLRHSFRHLIKRR